MGRTRGRRRLLSAAIVLASAGTAIALQAYPQVSSPQSNPAIPVGSNGRIVFSLRNNSTSSTTVNSFFGSGSDCLSFSSPVPLDPIVPSPWVIGPNAQLQFVTATAGFAATGQKFCNWFVSANPAGTSVTTIFTVMQSAAFDVQPTLMNFGSQAKSNTENQILAITGWQAAPADVTVAITSDPLGHFELVGCGTTTSCTVTIPGGGGLGSALVHCNAFAVGNSDGTLTVSAGATIYGQVTLQCDVGAGSGSGITISPMIGMQFAPVGMTDTAAYAISGSGSYTSATITSGLNTLAIQECGGVVNCLLAGPLPATLHVVCTPTSTTDSGSLTVSGAGGMATASIQCAPALGAPVLYVSKSSIAFPDTTVFAGSSDTFTIENHGSGSLNNVTLSLGTGGGDFAFSDCDAGSPCTVVAGTPKTITVYFRPLSHDLKQAQLGIVADGAGGSGSGPLTGTVSLSGTGLGGVMAVTAPAAGAYHLDFGTLPLNQTGSATISLRNDGNVSYTATIAGAAAPYALDMTMSDVGGNGGSASFAVTCGSTTPSANSDQTWTINSNAYAGSPQDITLSCAIADTNVVVDPLAFDFGEVRVGSPAQSMALTVTNPGPASAQIGSMQLRLAKPGLSLVPPTTMTTLAVGDAATATLQLDTGSDTDLADELVDIAVGSAMLALPVRGKVVTPHSRIAPDKLELGTACAGGQVTGMVRLVNDGTATLGVDQPAMDDGASFLAAVPGTMFPASLPPGMDITAEVAPTGAASGKISGMLTWHDDVPTTYQVPVTLEYVTSGTALSPRGLDFGAVAVDAMTASQSLKLENCDATAITFSVKTLRGVKGPIGAWVIEPRVGFGKTLAAHETQAMLVSFRPPARGHYEAELTIESDSGPQTVLLVGDATGRDFDHTSFYTCACSTPGEPWHGWPIALAIIVVSARRRRGSSSPR